MKLEPVTEIVLEGITVETEHIKYENKIRRVKLTDSKGHVVMISHPDNSQYAGLVVETLAKPDQVRKYQLTGVVKKLPVDEKFNDLYEAQNRKTELESLLNHDPIYLSEANLDIKEVMVDVP